MDSVKILHCADLHLGSKMSFLGGNADLLQSEQLLCFERIISLCNKEGVELLIISGDLFDGADIPDSYLQRVSDLLGSLKSTFVAICAGNHDYLCLGASPIEKLKKSENVFVFSKNNSVLEIKEKNLRVYGSSFDSVYCRNTNPFESFKADDAFLNVAVLHADLNADLNSNYNPLSASQIAASGMDYVALGHIHKKTDILQAGNTFYAYSGCVQGTGFDELGEKGVYMGEISKGRCDLEFVKVANRLFLSEKIDVSDCFTNNDIVVKIKTFINEKYPENALDNLYKITLTGNVDQGFTPDTAYVLAALKPDYFYIKVLDATLPKIDLAALSNQNTLKGMFVRRMLELLSDTSDTELLNLALQIGLKAFDGEVKAIEN